MKLLIFLLLIVGCASQPKKRTYSVDDIKNEDFKNVKKIKYSKGDDQFVKVESEFTDALNQESIQRVFTYGGSLELDGVMGDIGRLCYKKEFSKAYALIARNSKEYSENPIYWNQVGTCFLLEGKNRKALLFYNRALSIKGDYAPALNNLGVMYMQEKDYSRALVAFERARKSTAFGRTPRYNLANLYLSFGLYKQAEGHLYTLSQVSNKDVDVLNMLGVAQLMQGKSAAAIQNFQKIDSDFLEIPKYGINYALALYMDGKNEKAKDALDDVEKDNLRDWTKYYKKVSQYIGGAK